MGTASTMETEEKELQSEDISTQTRLKRKQSIRRNKAKLKLGRLRASKRVASRDVLKKRAKRAARSQMFKKVSSGKSRSNVSYSARGSYEKMVNMRKGAVANLTRKLIPRLRKAEMKRRSGGSR